MSMSLGVIETRGLIAAISAADTACKAADVSITSYKKIGSGLVSVCFSGEISAVKTAIECGVVAVHPPEHVLASLVIARPDQSVVNLLAGIRGKKQPVTAEEIIPTSVAKKAPSQKQPTISTPLKKTEPVKLVEAEVKALAVPKIAEPVKKAEPAVKVTEVAKPEPTINAGALKAAEVTKETKKTAVKSKKRPSNKPRK
ncbi:BMC domain-containing protein [Photobacterium lipolyticum]|nr:BMC domain-containing protein [Photobacterium lipolyticum]